MVEKRKNIPKIGDYVYVYDRHRLAVHGTISEINLEHYDQLVMVQLNKYVVVDDTALSILLDRDEEVVYNATGIINVAYYYGNSNHHDDYSIPKELQESKIGKLLWN